jgi:hypothetical protein
MATTLYWAAFGYLRPNRQRMPLHCRLCAVLGFVISAVYGIPYLPPQGSGEPKGEDGAMKVIIRVRRGRFGH